MTTRNVFPRVALMLPPGGISASYRQYFLNVSRSSLMINSLFTFLRVNSSHNPFDPLDTLSLVVTSPTVSTTIGESPIIKISPSLRTHYFVSRKRML